MKRKLVVIKETIGILYWDTLMRLSHGLSRINVVSKDRAILFEINCFGHIIDIVLRMYQKGLCDYYDIHDFRCYLEYLIEAFDALGI